MSTLEEVIASEPWNTLAHAYGEATDVPDLLRALFSPDAGARRDAAWALYGNIYHQGSIYSATPAAARAIIAGLGAPDLPTAACADALALLLHLATGHPEGKPALLDEVRAAVRGATSLLGAWLTAADQGARRRAVFLCGLADAVDQLRLAFAAADDEDARALIALALAETTIAAAELDALRAAESGELARLALAIAAAHRRIGEGSAAALDPAAFADEGAWSRLNALIDEDLLTSVGAPIELLQGLPHAQARSLLVAAASALAGEQDDDVAFGTAVDLLGVAFEDRTKGAPLDLAQLDEDSRAILTGIARCDAAWEVANTEMELADKLGRSVDRDELLGLLGLARPVTAVVVAPFQWEPAARACAAVGHPEWLRAGFVFYRGDGDAIEEAIPEAIPEGAEDFPPEVMAAARQVAGALMDWVEDLVPVEHWRFYPRHEVDALVSITRGLGWTVETLASPDDHGEEPVESDEATDENENENEDEDEDEGIEGLVRWDFLEELAAAPYQPRHHALSEAVAARLTARRFVGAREQAGTFAKLGRAGISVHPAAGGRRSGESCEVTVSLDFHADAARTAFASLGGAALPEAFLRVKVQAAGDDSFLLRACFADEVLLAALDQLLDRMDEYLRTRERRLILEPLSAAPVLLLEMPELGGGWFLPLEPRPSLT